MLTISKKIRISFRILLLYIAVSLEFSILTTTKISAQVVINEVSPSSNPEWIELYKTSEEKIPLEGCKLYLDDNHNIQKIEFSPSDQFEKEEIFKVISKGSYNWSSNWLNNNGDEVTLECSFGTDIVTYGNQSGATIAAPDSGKTFGRSPDGSELIVLLENSSEGSINSGELPTPTLKLSPTPKPTATPKPTSTPKPTKLPTKPPTASPKPTLKPSSSSVLGIEDDSNKNEETQFVFNDDSSQPSEKTEENQETSEETRETNSAYSLPLIILGLGTVLIGISVSPFIKKKLVQRMQDKKESERDIINK